MRRFLIKKGARFLEVKNWNLYFYEDEGEDR